MVAVLIDCKDVMHHVFLSEGQTVNKEHYLGVMRHFRGAVRLKRAQ